MRRLIASAAVAAALVSPLPAAQASESGLPVRRADCPPGYTGHVVEAWNEKRGWYEVTSFCIPWGPVTP